MRSYYYEVHDYIRTIFGYKPSRVIYNIDKVDFSGLEIEAGYRFSPRAGVFLNLTHQRTKKHGDILDSSSALTDDLPELPENKANIRFSYGRDRGLKGEIVIGWTDERKVVRGKPAIDGGSYLETLDSYCDMNARFSYPLYEKGNTLVRFEASLDNMLDQDIVEEYGYPMPGATAMAGLRVDF